jgi:hypothetical protein
LFFFIFLGMTLVFNSIPAKCQPIDESLAIADSLFEKERYTQSYEIYRDIFSTGRQYSPAMLLKMAFTQEALGDYSLALYYLDLYYHRTYNTLALKKMEELARQRNLLGYEYSDPQFFLNLYQRYRTQVYALLMAALFLMLAVLIWYRRSRKTRPVGGIILFASLLLLLLYLNNFAGGKPKAIIRQPGVHLMDGPSPGARLVEITDQGHRIEVLGKKDIWFQIRWREGTAWIRENSLETIDH